MCVDDTDNRGIRVVLSSRFQDMKALLSRKSG